MPFKNDEDDASNDDEVDEEADDDDDDDSVELSEDDDDGSEEDDETDADVDEEEEPSPPERRGRARGSDGSSGMGRRSTGPARRPAATHSPEATVSGAASSEAVSDSELAPDISQWPGTTDAARQVGRHPSTIKLWRTQGRIRALLDPSGCWRHHPEDLAEAIDTPDATDPGSVLASGMTAIVQQGASANERLLRMTEISTDGLKDAAKVLSEELKRAYVRIAELEIKLADLRDKHALTHADDLKHERFIRRLDQRHELEIAGAKETSARLNGLLTIIGPIAASIGARVLGLNAEAVKMESQALGGMPQASTNGASPSAPPSPHDPAPPSNGVASPASLSLITPTMDSRLVPIETRITDAMSRLCASLRVLDPVAFGGLRAMMPPNVQAALDDVRNGTSDSAVGAALATLVRVAQNLSDLQFKAVIPIAPAQIAAVLSELREMMRGDSPAQGPHP